MRPQVLDATRVRTDYEDDDENEEESAYGIFGKKWQGIGAGRWPRSSLLPAKRTV